MEPLIISSYDGGKNNADLEQTISRLNKEYAYKNLSCIQIVPAFGQIPTKIVASWLNMYAPPNQKFVRLFAMGLEVGEAYSKCIESILAHPELSKFKYILTIEHDNSPPPDGIVKILQRMEDFPEYSAIGGLYYTRGMGGVAQIWGDPKDPVLNFRPQVPIPNAIQECCGTGMGFTCFRLDMFKDENLRKPWFKTTANQEEGVHTQDLYFWADARKHGYKCAIDTNIRVGHYDVVSDITW